MAGTAVGGFFNNRRRNMATTREQIRTKLDEYDSAANDREQKGVVLAAKTAALEAAQGERDIASQDYRDALSRESALEDELEALIVDHEPPGIDAT